MTVPVPLTDIERMCTSPMDGITGTRSADKVLALCEALRIAVEGLEPFEEFDGTLAAAALAAVRELVDVRRPSVVPETAVSGRERGEERPDGGVADRVAALAAEGHCTDGDHHKDWFFEQIIAAVGVELESLYEPECEACGEWAHPYEDGSGGCKCAEEDRRWVTHPWELGTPP